MAVQFTPTPDDDLFPVNGLHIGVAQAAIKRAQRDDLTVFILDEGATVGGVFTQNQFRAAPVQICEKHLAQATHDRPIRALVVNTGNANAGTGTDGLVRAHQVCLSVAQHLGLSPEQVLPFSTGVIMETLPSEKIVGALQQAIDNAQSAQGLSNWGRAAGAIMTTDTVPKAKSKRVDILGKTVTITGISKGAGMIRPNMATMLGFLACDAGIAPELISEFARRIANRSFNCISVDGDTSTNDSFMLLATNQLEGVYISDMESPEAQVLLAALEEVAIWLAQAIVRDGEGATKFITIQVSGGMSEEQCKQVAYAVAHSPLVKTAFFASDPNLGRILAAVGYAGVADIDPSKIRLYLGDVLVFDQGGRSAQYREEDGQAVMRASDIVVRLELGLGSAEARVWTCDLSYDYVKINANYRS